MNEIDKNLSGKGKGNKARTDADRGKTASRDQSAHEQPAQKQPKDAKSQTKEPRVRTTDHEVRAMKMADGGFAKHLHIEQLEAGVTQVFTSVVAPKDKQRDRYTSLQFQSLFEAPFVRSSCG
jgi:hypothetical protein